MGKGCPHFGVTWLAGHNGESPSDDWREITTDNEATEILDRLKKHRRSGRYNGAERAGELGSKWNNDLII
jgi:hypothetical protein